MKKNQKKVHFIRLGVVVASLALLTLTSCKDTANIEDYVGVHKSDPYDPSKPVTISSFTPESGGLGQQIVINGSNFGNDVDKVSITIGGKPAVLVSAMSDCLYCYVPAGAFTGVIEVTVGDETTGTQTARAATNFNYERKMVVGKLCGYKNARDDQGWKDGPFETCCGFRNDGVMQFSPYNHDQLFIVYDREPDWTSSRGIQLVDLKERTLQTVLPLSKFNNQRLRTIDFCVDPFAYDEYGNWLGRAEEFWTDADYQNNRKTRWSEHLIISADNYSSSYEANSVYIVDRDQNGDFSSNSLVTPLANYNQCNGASIHPNGELYFTSYTQGQVLRLDMNTYWDCIDMQKIGERDGVDPRLIEAWDPSVNTNKFGGFKKLFNVQDQGFECQIDIHPTGKFAYIVVVNRQYILRTDYDENAKEFLPSYQIAGTLGVQGLVDGVGKSAKFSRPYQGTFVKNDEYVKDGKNDVYDFYLCDNNLYNDHRYESLESHAIRLLTPEGIVRTYAGGSAATHPDGKTYGSENGELRDVARFYRPTGLVNDFHIDKITGEKTLIFYILDTMNRCIRTITMEEPEDEPEVIEDLETESDE